MFRSSSVHSVSRAVAIAVSDARFPKHVIPGDVFRANTRIKVTEQDDFVTHWDAREHIIKLVIEFRLFFIRTGHSGFAYA